MLLHDLRHFSLVGLSFALTLALVLVTVVERYMKATKEPDDIAPSYSSTVICLSNRAD